MLRIACRKMVNFSKATKSNYLKVSDKHPYLLEAVQVGSLMGAGDLLTQAIIDKRRTFKEIKWRRTAEFAIVGFVYVGPLLRFWFIRLDKMVSKNQSLVKQTAKKVFFDQLIFDPPFLALFTLILSAVQQLTMAQTKERLRNEFIDVIKTNLLIWPAAQCINFAVIPLRFQVLFVEFIAIFWNAYISKVFNSEDIVKTNNSKTSTNESKETKNKS